MNLSDELFFLKRDPLPFELDNLKFLSVLTSQLEVLLFWLFEPLSLLLKLFVDRHYLLKILLHPLQVLL